MRKRIISSLLVLALILASLVACGDSDSSEISKVDTQQNESETGTEMVEDATEEAEIEDTQVVVEVEEETTETEKEDTTSENEGKKEGKKEEPKEEETTPSDPPADEPEEESSEVVDDGLTQIEREIINAGYYNVILTSSGRYGVLTKPSDTPGYAIDLINSYLATMGYEVVMGSVSGHDIDSYCITHVGEIQPINDSNPGFNF